MLRAMRDITKGKRLWDLRAEFLDKHWRRLKIIFFCVCEIIRRSVFRTIYVPGR